MTDSRETLIEIYEGILKKWDSPDSDLKYLFPEKYEEIKAKLRLLELQYDFNINHLK